VLKDLQQIANDSTQGSKHATNLLLFEMFSVNFTLSCGESQTADILSYANQQQAHKRAQKNSYQLTLISRINDFLSVITDTNMRIAGLKRKILNKYESTSKSRDMNLRKALILERIRILNGQVDCKIAKAVQLREQYTNLCARNAIRHRTLADMHTININRVGIKCSEIEKANKKKVLDLIGLKENLIVRQRALIHGLSKIYPIEIEQRFQPTYSLG
jgi:hypothetical protein